MTAQLYMLLAQAVVDDATGYRPGARHALMIYMTAPTLADAKTQALDFATERGWSFVELQRAKELSSNTKLIADDTLRSAAETALRKGGAMVVYTDEIPPNG